MTQDRAQRRLVCIGRISGALGLGGWLKVHAYTRERVGIFDYREWIIGSHQPPRRFRLESSRDQGRGLAVKLEGIDDRGTAVACIGESINVAPDQLPALDEGEYFWHQLEGLAVWTLDGTWLGTVAYLFETGANDVMVVAGDRERLIPYIERVVREVDLDAGRVRVDWDAEF